MTIGVGRCGRPRGPWARHRRGRGDGVRRPELAAAGALTLSNAHVEVTVLAGKGADIYSLVDLRTGVDVLWKTPWGLRQPGLWGRASSSQERWLEAYPGGWQLLLPNGGDECEEHGATWGFHGEAALVRWEVAEVGATSATLETELFSAPLHVTREFFLDGPVLRLHEVVRNLSPSQVEVMWSHHPAFGAPFVDQGCLLFAGCKSVVADDREPGTFLAAASEHDWPVVQARDGKPVDLGLLPGPEDRRAVLAYLSGFGSGWFAITNPRLRLGVGLRWPLEVFPCAWLWQEAHASAGWPWWGRAYVVAVEPASTFPGQGLANARAKGGRGVLLAGHSEMGAVVEAVLFEATGAVSGIEEGGKVALGGPEGGGQDVGA